MQADDSIQHVTNDVQFNKQTNAATVSSFSPGYSEDSTTSPLALSSDQRRQSGTIRSDTTSHRTHTHIYSIRHYHG